MVKFTYNQNKIDYIIDIKYLKNSEEIFIQCTKLNSFKFSKIYKISMLRNIDCILFGNNTPLEAFDLLCKHFRENQVFISEIDISKIRIVINKEVEPNWVFELLKYEENNNMDNEMLIGENNNINDNNINIIEEFEPNLDTQELSLMIGQPKDNQIVGETADLDYLLKFLLLKKLANKIKDINIYKSLISEDIVWLLKRIKKLNDSLENKNPSDEVNILNYINFFKVLDIHNNVDLSSIINKFFMDKSPEKDEIINYWKYLSKYQKYNNEFDFLKDLKNCHFDYSLIKMNIVERYNIEEYEQKKKECKNMKKMILYSLFEIEPNFNKLNMKLKYSHKLIYGKGYYFSDSIDYISSLKYNGNIPNIGETFSLMVCELFYDEKKLRRFKEKNPFKEFNQNNNLSFQAKVESNGLIKIENYYTYDNGMNINDKEKRVISNEYVLSEKYQIFPLYIFTLKRNEYFILYRDPNFLVKNKYSDFLKSTQKLSYQCMNSTNIYFEASTEESLKFLFKRKNQKVILITSIRLDYSGKRFVEIARKIYGFNLLVIFFSSVKNKKYNEKWLKDFPNCLFTTKFSLYKDYITKYNEDELKELRKKDEEENKMKLKEFSFDFISFPYCDNEIKYCFLKYIKNFPYFRKVSILCQFKNLYLEMTKEGIVEDRKSVV